jgi:glycosyltransferase involved in cell wall biosynthesis
MDMAGALSQAVDELSLVTASALTLRESPEEISAWYGIEPTFRIVRVPVGWKPLPFSEKNKSEREGKKNRPPTGWKNRFVLAASMYARLQRPDLVFTRCCRVARYTTSLGLPTVVEYHGSGTDAARQLKRSPLRDNFLALVTVSDYIRKDFELHGIPSEKILVEPGGIDLTPFTKSPSRHVAREQLGLPTDRQIVTYCGHFYEKKGVQYLIDVTRQLPDVCFCLVGGWPDDIARLKHQARDLTNVIFSGFVSHGKVPTYLAAADLLVLPNSGRCLHAHQTCPLKLFEYAGAQRPIVASRIPGIDCLVTHGQHAWLTEPDSSQDFLIGIERILGDSSLATRLANQANHWVQQYSWNERAKRILEHIGVLPYAAANENTPSHHQAA